MEGLNPADWASISARKRGLGDERIRVALNAKPAQHTDTCSATEIPVRPVKTRSFRISERRGAAVLRHDAIAFTVQTVPCVGGGGRCT